jgi:hypothetical protein
MSWKCFLSFRISGEFSTSSLTFQIERFYLILTNLLSNFTDFARICSSTSYQIHQNFLPPPTTLVANSKSNKGDVVKVQA